MIVSIFCTDGRMDLFVIDDISSTKNKMPAISEEDFSLPDDIIIEYSKNHQMAENALYKKLIELINLIQVIARQTNTYDRIKTEIETGRTLLAMNKDKFSAGYLIKNVGYDIFKYAEEIYDRNPEAFFKNFKVKHKAEISENSKIMDLIDLLSEVYKKLSPEEMASVFRVLTHIVDIVGATTMK